MKRGFACGMFDLFHAGHVMMLAECKAQCDYLLVALNTGENIDYAINPGKRKPVYSLEERIKIVEACKYVDEVITYTSEDDLIQILTNFSIDIRFLGDDYRNKPITGPGLIKELYYTNRSHGYSTSAIIHRIKES